MYLLLKRCHAFQNKKKRICLFPPSHVGGLTLCSVQRYRIILRKVLFSPFFFLLLFLCSVCSQGIDPYSQPTKVNLLARGLHIVLLQVGVESSCGSDRSPTAAYAHNCPPGVRLRQLHSECSQEPNAVQPLTY